MTQDDYNEIKWVLTSYEGTEITNYVSINTIPIFTKQVVSNKSATPHLRFSNGVKTFSSRKEFMRGNIVAFVDPEEELRKELKQKEKDDK